MLKNNIQVKIDESIAVMACSLVVMTEPVMFDIIDQSHNFIKTNKSSMDYFHPEFTKFIHIRSKW